MILVSDAGWRIASAFDACSTSPLLPSMTSDEKGGAYSSA
jgi:hypothetical protein